MTDRQAIAYGILNAKASVATAERALSQLEAEDPDAAITLEMLVGELRMLADELTAHMKAEGASGDPS